MTINTKKVPLVVGKLAHFESFIGTRATSCFVVAFSFFYHSRYRHISIFNLDIVLLSWLFRFVCKEVGG